MPDAIIESIRSELREQADPAFRESTRRFFKEEVRVYGVRTAAVRAIAKEHFRRINDRGKPEIFALCEELLASGCMEEVTVAFDWADRLQKSYEPADFAVFERWLATFVSNWAACDTLCNHPVGTFLERYPGYLPRLKEWARSPNRWVRRGAAVSLVLPARKGKFLDEVFAIAEILLDDEDDLVQKGYGWMLKEAGKPYRDEVFAFVMARKDRMPRTALRYAIEKMPEEWRREAMGR
jgi:3-methyladenine DNA glycosylase AlkD